MGNTSILRLRGSLVAAERYVFKKRMARIGWYADDIWFVATEYLVGMLCIYWPSICTESILQLFIYLFIYLERFSESVQITKKSIIGNLLTSIQSINDKRLQLWSHLPSFCYFMSRLNFYKILHHISYLFLGRENITTRITFWAASVERGKYLYQQVNLRSSCDDRLV